MKNLVLCFVLFAFSFANYLILNFGLIIKAFLILSCLKNSVKDYVKQWDIYEGEDW
jgi:hypothetical protein